MEVGVDELFIQRVLLNDSRRCMNLLDSFGGYKPAEHPTNVCKSEIQISVGQNDFDVALS